MSTEHPFVLFDAVHVFTLVALGLAGVVIVYGTHRWASPRRTRWIGVSIGIFMIVQEIGDRTGHHLMGGEPLENVLPFHMCGASVFLTALMLINRSRRIYELVYFWGLAGAPVALLTPDIRFGFPHILNITYFTSHALIIVGVLFMTFNYHYRPTLRSLGRALIITNVYMVAIVVPINLLLGTNYLYVCQKPEGLSLLDYMGPWPWYILGMEIVGTLCFTAVYVPYLVADYLTRSRRATSRGAGSECLRPVGSTQVDPTIRR